MLYPNNPPFTSLQAMIDPQRPQEIWRDVHRVYPKIHWWIMIFPFYHFPNKAAMCLCIIYIYILYVYIYIYYDYIIQNNIIIYIWYIMHGCISWYMSIYVYIYISFSGQNLKISQCQHEKWLQQFRRPEHFHQGIQDFRRDTTDTRNELFEVGADLQDPWPKTTNWENKPNQNIWKTMVNNG